MHTLDLAAAAGKPGDPNWFTGPVTMKPCSEDLGDVKLFRVEFAPGARTNWHTHSGVQLLVVAEGRCRFQRWGGQVAEAGAGEAIYIPAGEKHWHGAAIGSPMAHWAVNIDLDTEWLEAVTDEQYSGR